MKSKKTKLPGFADKILKRILPEKIINTAIGDYEELYANIREDQGRLKAELWIYAQILRSILPYMFNIICWRSTMLKNYLKIAFRNLKRNKGFSFITISSLSVGITCTMLIVLWVQDELSFDRFHENTEDIYRVITETQAADQIYSKPAVPTPLVTTLKDEYPEVLNVCRFRGGFSDWRVQYGEKIFINDRVGIADPSFFELFSFRLLKGNPENALTERYSIVLTEGMADKYFDNEEPMGKQLLIAGSRTSMTVTGVMENIPQNSHMQFDFIIPIENMDYWWSEDFTDWGRLRFNAFIQLSDDASGEEFSDKISDIVKQHHPETGITRTYLQPLIDAHFSQDFTQDNENFGKSNIMYIYALSILAAILLFIACINYMNLSTARSVYRSKEIGVRKVTGAYRSDIIKQVFT
ncbi:MAG: hypothetical protein GY863_04425, partial [bacterium]|nr:hypothetical protein [bacterium]